jgi:hypothetical protein
MKKISRLLIIVCLFSMCGPKQEEVERTIENGVEVVINHREPYQVGRASSLSLEEVFKIDTENKATLDLGIPDIFGFEVNSAGEIFILRNVTGEGNFVYKFDSSGKFVKSFGRQGEGPGEFQNPHHISMDDNDNLLIVDLGPQKLLKYTSDGVFIDDHRMSGEDARISAAPENKMLAMGMSFGQDNENAFYSFSLRLLDADFTEIKVIDQFSFEVNPKKIRAADPFFCWSASEDFIFVANENRGYEIWVFDSNGRLVRKIRKDYQEIPLSEDYKKKILTPLPEPLKAVAYFPEFFPPFQSIVAGDDGKLFVSTFEKGENPGEFLFDVFNEDGVFIGRKSLNIYAWEANLWARVRAGRFYCLQEKPNGYKELVVYKMGWE